MIKYDREIESRKPDFVNIKKKERNFIITDISVSRDTRISRKEKTKEEKYQDLTRNKENLKKYFIC